MSKTKPKPAETEPAMFDLGDAQPVVDPIAEEIHAEHCVVGSECNMTDSCRGKLKATAAVNGKVQVYCPVCMKFAKGTRSLQGLASGVGRLFNRSLGRAQ